MAEDIEQRIKKVIVERLGVSEDKLTPEATFLGDLGADSLDLVELVMGLEEEFKPELGDKEIPEEDSQNLKTVGDVIKYITEKANA